MPQHRRPAERLRSGRCGCLRAFLIVATLTTVGCAARSASMFLRRKPIALLDERGIEDGPIREAALLVEAGEPKKASSGCLTGSKIRGPRVHPDRPEALLRRGRRACSSTAARRRRSTTSTTCSTATPAAACIGRRHCGSTTSPTPSCASPSRAFRFALGLAASTPSRCCSAFRPARPAASWRSGHCCDRRITTSTKKTSILPRTRTRSSSTAFRAAAWPRGHGCGRRGATCSSTRARNTTRRRCSTARAQFDALRDDDAYSADQRAAIAGRLQYVEEQLARKKAQLQSRLLRPRRQAAGKSDDRRRRRRSSPDTACRSRGGQASSRCGPMRRRRRSARPHRRRRSRQPGRRSAA